MAFRPIRGGSVLIPSALLLCVLTVLAPLLAEPGLIATKLLITMIAAALVWSISQRMRRTNLAIARFLDAISHSDLSQGFGGGGKEYGFGELAGAMDNVLGRLRRERIAAIAENQFASALVNEVPTALLVIGPDDVVLLVNKASRRLFQDGNGRCVGEFTRYGAEFGAALTRAAPGTRSTCRVLADGLLQRAIITCAALEREGGVWRAVSTQIIQSELDAAELATQVDLVRILTHEIMNSLTPVTSLAASAVQLIAEVQLGDAEALSDARLAIETLARRAQGINRFVELYREFSQSPSIVSERFEVGPWLLELVHAFSAAEYGQGIEVDLDLTPSTLYMDADANLLGQVLLNLMKNGAEAARGHASAPRLTVSAALHQSNRVRLAVCDNGPGVPQSIRSDIFLPFFTTKATGMGVGLSFARQIILLHGGGIGVVETTTGATFEIVI
jgi:two-component system nitrogen regulation sensor histidine kinase NtrY